MKKQEFLKMLVEDNSTEKEPNKTLFSDVIDCIEIALSQEGEDFEVATEMTLEQFFKEIKEKAKITKSHCVGPFEAAELFAKMFNARYTRATKIYESTKTVKQTKIINIEDFI